MSTKKRISESFWIDKLTNRRYSTVKDLPDHVNASRFEYWDSNLEFNCYQHLLQASKNEKIIRQSERLILPASHPFNALTWNCDFELIGDNRKLIEVKGTWILNNGEALSNFVKTLRLLSLFNPIDFNDLIIISNKKFSLGRTKIKVHHFEDLPTLLYS